MRQSKVTHPLPLEPNEPTELPEFDVERLLANSGEILRREIKHLMRESAANKLSAASSRDLATYIKLLHELKREAEKQLENLTDEELKKLQGSET